MKRITAALLTAAFACSDLAFAAPDLNGGAYGHTPLQMILEDPSRFEPALNFSSLKEIHKSPSLGGETPPLLIHIQDAHANYSGQVNLASTLDDLLKKYDISTVFVEGASRDVTLDPLKELIPSKDLSRIAKTLLLEGEIAGEEYLNLTSKYPMKLQGVEDQVLYLQSVRSYGALADKRDKALSYLTLIQRAVDKLKKKHYPKELLAYEKVKQEDGRQKTVDEIYKKLFELAGQKDGLASYPNLTKLKTLQDKESQIDFTKANLEQAALLQDIFQRGGIDGLEDSLKNLSRSKDSKLSQMTAIRSLLEAANTKTIDSSKYPDLLAYKAYLDGFTDIDLEKVLEERVKLEDQVYVSAIKNVIPAQAGIQEKSVTGSPIKAFGDDSNSADALLIRSIDRYINLLFTAYKIQMTTDDFKAFALNEPDFTTASYLAFLNRKLAEEGFVEDLISYDTILEDAQKALTSFYDSVEQRDQAFMGNMERFLDSRVAAVGVHEEGAESPMSGQPPTGPASKVAVLITGGYHTSHLSQLFQEKGYSYIVLTPTITQETNQKKYENLLLSILHKDQKKIHLSQDISHTDKSLSALDGDLAFANKKAQVKAMAFLQRLGLPEIPHGARLSQIMGVPEEKLRGVGTRLTEIKDSGLETKDDRLSPKSKVSGLKSDFIGARMAEKATGDQRREISLFYFWTKKVNRFLIAVLIFMAPTFVNIMRTDVDTLLRVPMQKIIHFHDYDPVIQKAMSDIERTSPDTYRYLTSQKTPILLADLEEGIGGKARNSIFFGDMILVSQRAIDDPELIKEILVHEGTHIQRQPSKNILYLLYFHYSLPFDLFEEEAQAYAAGKLSQSIDRSPEHASRLLELWRDKVRTNPLYAFGRVEEMFTLAGQLLEGMVFTLLYLYWPYFKKIFLPATSGKMTIDSGAVGKKGARKVDRNSKKLGARMALLRPEEPSFAGQAGKNEMPNGKNVLAGFQGSQALGERGNRGFNDGNIRFDLSHFFAHLGNFRNFFLNISQAFVNSPKLVLHFLENDIQTMFRGWKILGVFGFGHKRNLSDRIGGVNNFRKENVTEGARLAKINGIPHLPPVSAKGAVGRSGQVEGLPGDAQLSFLRKIPAHQITSDDIPKIINALEGLDRASRGLEALAALQAIKEAHPTHRLIGNLLVEFRGRIRPNASGARLAARTQTAQEVELRQLALMVGDHLSKQIQLIDQSIQALKKWASISLTGDEIKARNQFLVQAESATRSAEGETEIAKRFSMFRQAAGLRNAAFELNLSDEPRKELTRLADASFDLWSLAQQASDAPESVDKGLWSRVVANSKYVDALQGINFKAQDVYSQGKISILDLISMERALDLLRAVHSTLEAFGQNQIDDLDAHLKSSLSSSRVEEVVSQIMEVKENAESRDAHAEIEKILKANLYPTDLSVYKNLLQAVLSATTAEQVHVAIKDYVNENGARLAADERHGKRFGTRLATRRSFLSALAVATPSAWNAALAAGLPNEVLIDKQKSARGIYTLREATAVKPGNLFTVNIRSETLSKPKNGKLMLRLIGATGSEQLLHASEIGPNNLYYEFTVSSPMLVESIELQIESPNGSSRPLFGVDQKASLATLQLFDSAKGARLAKKTAVSNGSDLVLSLDRGTESYRGITMLVQWFAKYAQNLRLSRQIVLYGLTRSQAFDWSQRAQRFNHPLLEFTAPSILNGIPQASVYLNYGKTDSKTLLVNPQENPKKQLQDSVSSVQFSAHTYAMFVNYFLKDYFEGQLFEYEIDKKSGDLLIFVRQRGSLIDRSPFANSLREEIFNLPAKKRTAAIIFLKELKRVTRVQGAGYSMAQSPAGTSEVDVLEAIRKSDFDDFPLRAAFIAAQNYSQGGQDLIDLGASVVSELLLDHAHKARQGARLAAATQLELPIVDLSAIRDLGRSNQPIEKLAKLSNSPRIKTSDFSSAVKGGFNLGDFRYRAVRGENAILTAIRTQAVETNKAQQWGGTYWGGDIDEVVSRYVLPDGGPNSLSVLFEMAPDAAKRYQLDENRITKAAVSFGDLNRAWLIKQAPSGSSILAVQVIFPGIKKSSSGARLAITLRQLKRFESLFNRFLQNPSVFDEASSSRSEAVRGLMNQGVSGEILIDFLSAKSVPVASAVSRLSKGRASVVKLPVSASDLVSILNSHTERGLDVHGFGDQRYLVVAPGNFSHLSQMYNLPGSESTGPAVTSPFQRIALFDGHSHPRFTSAEPSRSDGGFNAQQLRAVEAFKKQGAFIVYLDNPAGELGVTLRRPNTFSHETFSHDEAVAALEEIGILERGATALSTKGARLAEPKMDKARVQALNRMLSLYLNKPGDFDLTGRETLNSRFTLIANEMNADQIAAQLVKRVVPVDKAVKRLGQGRASVISLPVSEENLAAILDSTVERSLELYVSNQRAYLLVVPGDEYNSYHSIGMENADQSGTTHESPMGFMALYIGHSHPRFTDAEPSSMDGDFDRPAVEEYPNQGAFILTLKNRPQDFEVTVREPSRFHYRTADAEEAVRLLQKLGVLETPSGARLTDSKRSPSIDRNNVMLVHGVGFYSSFFDHLKGIINNLKGLSEEGSAESAITSTSYLVNGYRQEVRTSFGISFSPTDPRISKVAAGTHDLGAPAFAEEHKKNISYQELYDHIITARKQGDKKTIPMNEVAIRYKTGNVIDGVWFKLRDFPNEDQRRKQEASSHYGAAITIQMFKDAGISLGDRITRIDSDGDWENIRLNRAWVEWGIINEFWMNGIRVTSMAELRDRVKSMNAPADAELKEKFVLIEKALSDQNLFAVPASQPENVQQALVGARLSFTEKEADLLRGFLKELDKIQIPEAENVNDESLRVLASSLRITNLSYSDSVKGIDSDVLGWVGDVFVKNRGALRIAKTNQDVALAIQRLQRDKKHLQTAVETENLEELRKRYVAGGYNYFADLPMENGARLAAAPTRSEMQEFFDLKGIRLPQDFDFLNALGIETVRKAFENDPRGFAISLELISKNQSSYLRTFTELSQESSLGVDVLRKAFEDNPWGLAGAFSAISQNAPFSQNFARASQEDFIGLSSLRIAFEADPWGFAHIFDILSRESSAFEILASLSQESRLGRASLRKAFENHPQEFSQALNWMSITPGFSEMFTILIKNRIDPEKLREYFVLSPDNFAASVSALSHSFFRLPEFQRDGIFDLSSILGSTKIVFDIYEVASLNAAKGMVMAYDLRPSHIIIQYGGEVDVDLARRYFPDANIEFRGERDASKPDEINIRFHDPGSMDGVSASTLGIPYSFFKYNLPRAFISEEVDALKRAMNLDRSREVWVTSSSEQEEIQGILDAFGKQDPAHRPLLILGLRQPDHALKARLAEQGYKVFERNPEDQEPGKPFNGLADKQPMGEADIIILNTRGELYPLWSVADHAIVREDGNFMEPISQGKTLLYFRGRHFNNREILKFLKAEGAAEEITDLGSQIQKRRQNPNVHTPAEGAGKDFEATLMPANKFFAELMLLAKISAGARLAENFRTADVGAQFIAPKTDVTNQGVINHAPTEVSRFTGARLADIYGSPEQKDVANAAEVRSDTPSARLLASIYNARPRGLSDRLYNFYFANIKRNGAVKYRTETSKDAEGLSTTKVYADIYAAKGLLSREVVVSLELTDLLESVRAEKILGSVQAPTFAGMVEPSRGDALRENREIFEVVAQISSQTRLFGRLYSKAQAAPRFNSTKAVILRHYTGMSAQLDGQAFAEIQLIADQREFLRKVAGQNVFVEFVYRDAGGNLQLHEGVGLSDVVDADVRSDQATSTILMGELSKDHSEILDVAASQSYGIALTQKLGEGQVRNFIGEALFSVVNARSSEDSVSEPLRQMWNSLRSDPTVELTPEVAKQLRKVEQANFNQYKSFTFKALTRLAIDKFLEARDLILQAVGSAA